MVRKTKLKTHLRVQQIVQHDIMRAIRVLRERGMSNSLILNEHRVAGSK